MMGLFILGMTVIVALAIFPVSNVLRDRSGSFSRAAVLAQRKMEQIRQLSASQITATGLRTAGIVDTTNSTTATTLTFTTVDSLATELTQGTGTVQLTGVGTDLVRADVTISWTALRGQRNRINAMSYFADKSVWREP
jgi:hypothetical protein